MTASSSSDDTPQVKRRDIDSSPSARTEDAATKAAAHLQRIVAVASAWQAGTAALTSSQSLPLLTLTGAAAPLLTFAHCCCYYCCSVAGSVRATPGLLVLGDELQDLVNTALGQCVKAFNDFAAMPLFRRFIFYLLLNTAVFAETGMSQDPADHQAILDTLVNRLQLTLCTFPEGRGKQVTMAVALTPPKSHQRIWVIRVNNEVATAQEQQQQQQRSSSDPRRQRLISSLLTLSAVTAAGVPERPRRETCLPLSRR
jgi:hypothetical protein